MVMDPDFSGIYGIRYGKLADKDGPDKEVWFDLCWSYVQCDDDAEFLKDHPWWHEAPPGPWDKWGSWEEHEEYLKKSEPQKPKADPA
jgi:hypothetical protein